GSARAVAVKQDGSSAAYVSVRPPRSRWAAPPMHHTYRQGGCDAHTDGIHLTHRGAVPFRLCLVSEVSGVWTPGWGRAIRHVRPPGREDPRAALACRTGRCPAITIFRYPITVGFGRRGLEVVRVGRGRRRPELGREDSICRR